MQKIFQAQTSQTLEAMEPTDPDKDQIQFSDSFFKASSQSQILQKIIQTSNNNDIKVYRKTLSVLKNMLQNILIKQNHYYKQNLETQFIQFISSQQNKAQEAQQILENSSVKIKNINKIASMSDRSNQILQTVHSLLLKVNFFRKKISIAKQKIKNRQYSIKEKLLSKKNKKQYLSHLVILNQLKNKIKSLSSIKVNKIYLDLKNQQIQTIKVTKQQFQDLILQSSKAYHQLEELYFRTKISYSTIKESILKLMIQILIFRMTLKHVTFLKNLNQVNDVFDITKQACQQYFNSFDSCQVIIQTELQDQQQFIIIQKKKHLLQHRVYLKCKKFVNLIEYIKYYDNSCEDFQDQYWIRMETYFLKEVQGIYHVSIEQINKIGSLMQIKPQTQTIYQKFKNISLQNFTSYYFKELQNLKNSQYIEPNEVKLVLYDFNNKFKWIIEYLNRVKHQNDTFKQLHLNPNLEFFEIIFFKIVQPLVNIFIEIEMIEIKTKFQDKKDSIMQFVYNKNFNSTEQCCLFVDYQTSLKFLFNKFVSCQGTQKHWQNLKNNLKKNLKHVFCFCKSFQKNGSCNNTSNKKKPKQKIAKVSYNQKNNDMKYLQLLLKIKNQQDDKNIITERQDKYFYEEKLIQKQKKNCRKLDIKKIQDYFEQKSLVLQSISKFWSHKFELNKSCDLIEVSDLQCIQFLNQFKFFFAKFTDFIIQRQIKNLSNQQEELESYVQVFNMVLQDLKNLESNKKQNKKKIAWDQWDDLVQKIYSLTIKINSRQHKKWLLIKSCLSIQFYNSIKQKFNKKCKKSQNQTSIFKQLLNITDAHYKHKFEK